MMNQVLLHVLYTTHVTCVFFIIIWDGTNKRKEWRQEDYNVKYLAQAYTVLQTNYVSQITFGKWKMTKKLAQLIDNHLIY